MKKEVKTLFSNNQAIPLADRLRPRNLTDFMGQEEVVGLDKPLRRLIEKDQLVSLIFWGPPGTGKTTLARIIAEMTKSEFITLSAVDSGKEDLRQVVRMAEQSLKVGKRTILFIDEIHRWNKAQQDALLPHVEKGTLILIGATTENPSFEVISALLSRSRVIIFHKLTGQNIADILVRAVKDKDRGLGNFKIKISKDIIAYLARLADGDARVALNALELAVNSAKVNKGEVIEIDEQSIRESLQKTHLLYDRAGEEHYNIISALHKSMRGSDADASLYWMARMLEAGEDPLYVARRVVRFASEDIGLADPQALTQAVAAYQACHFIGMPECNVILAQAVAYCAKAPKSNKLYTAYTAIQKDIRELPAEPVPLHLRNAPTKLMKNVGYGKDYKYTPDYSPEEAKQDYLPQRLKGKKYL